MWRKSRSARRAVEQRAADFTLQVGNLLADRRLRDTQLATGFAEGFMISDGANVAYMSQLHRLCLWPVYRLFRWSIAEIPVKHSCSRKCLTLYTESQQKRPRRMWIVKVALSRPYTFIVLAILILIAAPVVILRTPTDIFPNIDIPVISIAWQYTGLNPEELEGRLTTPYEKVLTTLVDNIEHTESTTIAGQVVVKVYLQPGASLDTANAQVSSTSQFILRNLPPGILP